MHQLLAHDPLVSPAFLTGKFIDDLSDAIKPAVLMHHPKDLDTASALAILQEELLMGQPSKEYKKLDSAYHARRSFSSLGGHYVKYQPPDSAMSYVHRPNVAQANADDKLSALMTYRKARGLCFKCGAKWGPQHKCSASVPL